ncbi:MAG: class I SAM-dependent methyltransferase, partial [Candidatus Aenigmarchaeota archaeon]|nr:class I SAM-dependent methyltransferase [Candidatus Aenigmarchaeota archaeon]
LDVGCGIGEFLETHPNSVGCDINKNSIKYCHDKNLMVFYCNIEKNTPKETYDGIFCSNVIEHLKNYTNGLNNINESLKEGGILIILLPNKRGYKRDKTHNPKFNYNELIIWLKNKNYKIKKSNLLKLPIPLCFNDIVLICKK